MPARLDGRRVVVTRGKQGEDALSSRLQELGAEVVEVPSIALAPPAEAGDLDHALRSLGSFDWVAFASAHAVDATCARQRALGLPQPPASVRLAAVGPATAARLAALWRPPDLVPESASGEALAVALAARVRGRRVLVPRAAGGRPELLEGLAAAGAEVLAVEAYRTVPVSPEAMAPLADGLARGEIDAVTFASPSAVRSVVAGLGQRAGLLARASVAVIGPTTAEAARAAGLRVEVQPAEASARALADALAAHLGPR
jgi:uroporphyrinogen-III synthase